MKGNLNTKKEKIRKSFFWKVEALLPCYYGLIAHSLENLGVSA